MGGVFCSYIPPCGGVILLRSDIPGPWPGVILALRPVVEWHTRATWVKGLRVAIDRFLVGVQPHHHAPQAFIADHCTFSQARIMGCSAFPSPSRSTDRIISRPGSWVQPHSISRIRAIHSFFTGFPPHGTKTPGRLYSLPGVFTISFRTRSWTGAPGTGRGGWLPRPHRSFRRTHGGQPGRRADP